MGAVLNTTYLPPRLLRNLANGLDARYLELQRDSRTGYRPGAVDVRVAELVSDTRQAFALGLLAYLPEWAE
jgi:hypothetical protein